MKNGKNIIIISLISLFIIFSMVLIYVFMNKYDDVDILSVRKEYNHIFQSKTDTLNIPIYIGKRNTFLSNFNEIESTSISSSDYTLSSSLEAIAVGSTLFYNNDKYYEYIYHLSFSLYDDFDEPIFLNDGLFNITYKNGNKLSFEIGNLALLFNSHIVTTGDMIFTKLSALTDEIDGIETIVGINATIRNNNDFNIHIKSISLGNKHYELDYMNYKTNTVDSVSDLSSNGEEYNYKELFIDDGDMSLIIERKNMINLFIPLKYTKSIVCVERFPIYVTYEINGNEMAFIQDDFQFVKHINDLEYNDVKKYVYRYN